jgi:branched-chain amino acid transport system ATP-binding protein
MAAPRGGRVSAAVLDVRGLTRRFGGLTAVDRLDFTLPGGQLHAIIGPNGAGKTTFFNLVSGFIAADAGSVLFQGEEILGKPPHRIARMGIARTLQIKSVFGGLPVYDNVWIAAEARKKFLHPLKPMRSFTGTAKEVERILAEVGLEQHAREIAGNLSYGDVALLEIAIALATRPRLLLLDEPISGMSPEETERTSRKIKELSKTVDIILIEHDMEVVFGIADAITVMNQGRVLAQGRPMDVAKDPRVQEAYLGAPEEEPASPAPGEGRKAGA